MEGHSIWSQESEFPAPIPTERRLWGLHILNFLMENVFLTDLCQRHQRMSLVVDTRCWNFGGGAAPIHSSPAFVLFFRAPRRSEFFRTTRDPVAITMNNYSNPTRTLSFIGREAEARPTIKLAVMTESFGADLPPFSSFWVTSPTEKFKTWMRCTTYYLAVKWEMSLICQLFV